MGRQLSLPSLASSVAGMRELPSLRNRALRNEGESGEGIFKRDGSGIATAAARQHGGDEIHTPVAARGRMREEAA